MRLKFSDGKFVDISFDKELSLTMAFTLWVGLQTFMGQEDFQKQLKDWQTAMVNGFFTADGLSGQN
jgi:hypothetical protein